MTPAPWKKSYDKPRQHIKKQRCYFADIAAYTQSCSFSSSHVWMWELSYKKSWAPKNWYFWSVMVEKTLDSPLDFKEIKPVNPKGNQSWLFTGRTDAEAPIIWPPDVKSQLIRKDPYAGKEWRQEEKRMTEHEMVGWHHWLNGHELSLSRLQEMVKDRQPWCAAVHEVTESQTWLSDWTTTEYLSELNVTSGMIWNTSVMLLEQRLTPSHVYSLRIERWGG